MAQGIVSKLREVPVDGTQFKFKNGQEVYILLDSADELKEGKIVLCGSYLSSAENVYRVELQSKVRCVYNESSLIGRRYGMFDKRGNMLEGKIFYSKQDAIDAEEDCGYDSLTAQYHAADGMPNEMISEAIEVWEINEVGVRIGMAVVID